MAKKTQVFTDRLHTSLPIANGTRTAGFIEVGASGLLIRKRVTFTVGWGAELAMRGDSWRQTSLGYLAGRLCSIVAGTRLTTCPAATIQHWLIADSQVHLCNG